MVHENFRFQPWHREIKKLLDCRSHRRQAPLALLPHADGRRLGRRRLPGSAALFPHDAAGCLIFETGVHFIDTFRYLGGEIDGVYGNLRKLNPVIAGEDAGLVVFEFASGAVGVWDANRYNECNDPDPRFTFGEFLVEGNGGSIRLYLDGRITVQRLGEEEIEHEYHHPRRAFAGDCVYVTQRHFVDGMLDDRPFETDGDDYLRTLAVQEASTNPQVPSIRSDNAGRLRLPAGSFDRSGTRVRLAGRRNARHASVLERIRTHQRDTLQMTKKYQIAVVPGDGIGHEIVPASLDVLQAATGNRSRRPNFPSGPGIISSTARSCRRRALEILRPFDAILFGAVGLPEVDDTLPAKDYTFKVRCGFRQYVNYRPCKRLRRHPRARCDRDADFDFVIIRENNEGEFILTGSEHHLDAAEGFATQMSVFTRQGNHAGGPLRVRAGTGDGKKLTNVTKSNTLIHSLKYWDRVIEEVLREFPDVEYERMYVDAAAANMVLKTGAVRRDADHEHDRRHPQRPGRGAGRQPGPGPSGNINPEREFPSMFEPIHGSAPDIAGQGIANPIGSIESGALMLEHLGEADAAQRIHRAVAETLAAKIWTPDLGGTATTREITAAVIERIES